jgi:osmotically inducible protein OsmC
MATDTGTTISRRRAETVWTGSVTEGGGTTSFQSSGVIPEQQVSLASRAAEKPEKQTDPEELIAAAHSTCYAMAFSNVLTQDGTPPEELDVKATVSLDKIEAGFAISSSKLVVTGKVPGLTQEQFADAAKRADEHCPVSNALRGNLQISVEATLQS